MVCTSSCAMGPAVWLMGAVSAWPWIQMANLAGVVLGS